MLSKGQNDYCANCGQFNSVLKSVCCECGWHVEGRPATDTEVSAVKSKLDGAIAGLETALSAPPTKAETVLLAREDQLAARLRDMTEGERREAVERLCEETGLSEEDALDWVRRLIEEKRHFNG